MADGDEWMDAEAAARYLGLHANTIYRMVHDGQLSAMRFPVRIRREDLDACFERCRLKPGELTRRDRRGVRSGAASSVEHH